MSAEKSIDALVSDVGIDLTDVMPGELRPTPKSSTEIPNSLDLDRPPLPPQVDDSIVIRRSSGEGASHYLWPIRLWRRCVQRTMSGRSGVMASAVVHGVALIVLSLIVIAGDEIRRRQPDLISSLLPVEEPEMVALDKTDQTEPWLKLLTSPGELSDNSVDVNIPDLSNLDDQPRESPRDASQAPGTREMTPAELVARVDRSGGGALAGRGRKARSRLAKERGGTPASENAVRMALAWLAAHQRRDGSWRFNHNTELCEGRCRNPGSIGSTTGATALALLPFLGAGHTHRSGDYQDAVQRGIYYLRSRLLVTDSGGDLQEGTMYAQALATIALCEAYAMTDDDGLLLPCQSALEFIINAQDPRGGGWRYIPREVGDTTSTGWHLMALKSGQMAGLGGYSPSFELAGKFLDHVQTDGGAMYGYRRGERKPTTTAIGLLARMYTGWPRKQPALARGVKFLSHTGPSKTDVYYNYYATQVLHHYEGRQWKAWNAKLRDFLVTSQATDDHERGSWHFAHEHSKTAGRLYSTAMCAMTLEVYYRYLPLYGKRAVDDDF